MRVTFGVILVMLNITWEPHIKELMRMVNKLK